MASVRVSAPLYSYHIACFVLTVINMDFLMYELINLSDNYLVFSGDINFNYSNFLTLINYVPTVIRLSSDAYICVCTYLYYCTSYIINNNNNIIIIIIAFSFLNSVASLLISRATTEKSAFYFSDSPF